MNHNLRRCGTCKWWYPRPKTHECRVHPPQWVWEKAFLFLRWPEPSQDDFCGQWEPYDGRGEAAQAAKGGNNS